jgi:lipopolysaccharide/colanic/teichoic acid biosynthesis glycosyltransferase
MIKRAFDLLVAAAGLVLIAPLLTLIAIAVKLDSGGPVLFRQERVGRHGEIFRIRKFRSMVQDAPRLGASITVGRDPRITRVGHWLRRYKLDELPQLIDVLVGDMSLVGPRPEVPRYVALYPPEVRERVLSVRPGITDNASLAFIDENAQLAGAADPEKEYTERILPQKLRLYLDYVENQSFARDLAILGRTAARIVLR